MKTADYKSPEFFNILATINKFLEQNNLNPIAAAAGKIFASQYNCGLYNNKVIWRVTNSEYPQLMLPGIIDSLKDILFNTFPEYIQSKTITLGNPRYTVNKAGNKMASITIILGDLADNVISLSELNLLETDPDILAKCLEVESRMFRRDQDNREPLDRLEDFRFSMTYEKALTESLLLGVSNLHLLHQVDKLILEPDYQADFEGVINGKTCKIEGKSTKANILYEELGQEDFAKYIINRIESGSLGSLHNSEYCLLVIKNTGEVICFEVSNPHNSWIAGQLYL